MNFAFKIVIAILALSCSGNSSTKDILLEEQNYEKFTPGKKIKIDETFENIIHDKSDIFQLKTISGYKISPISKNEYHDLLKSGVEYSPSASIYTEKNEKFLLLNGFPFNTRLADKLVLKITNNSAYYEFDDIPRKLVLSILFKENTVEVNSAYMHGMNNLLYVKSKLILVKTTEEDVFKYDHIDLYEPSLFTTVNEYVSKLYNKYENTYLSLPGNNKIVSTDSIQGVLLNDPIFEDNHTFISSEGGGYSNNLDIKIDDNKIDVFYYKQTALFREEFTLHFEKTI